MFDPATVITQMQLWQLLPYDRMMEIYKDVNIDTNSKNFFYLLDYNRSTMWLL